MYFGKPLRRREDERFLRGSGNYVDDIRLPGAVSAVFVRSPHAHALIRGISTGRAAAMPGVLRVLSAADWAAAGLGKLVCVHPMRFSDGRPMNESLRPLFARDKVCHVGDVIGCVIAETRHQGEDAPEPSNVMSAG